MPEQEYIRETKDKIQELQQTVRRSESWINMHLVAEDKAASYGKIVDIRRELKKIDYAISQNQSAALFGESQVGKSYLVKNLLSVDGSPFLLKDEANNKEYNFLEDINPRGQNVEATSVVTRFAINVEAPDLNYPILIRVFSPKDIALSLIDSCYSELRESLINLPQEEIKERLQSLEDSYKSERDVQDIFTEDDIYDIRDYIVENYSTALIPKELGDLHYWSVAADIISKLPHDKWSDLICLLWAGNKDITEYFNRLIVSLKKIDFVNKVYCKFDAVLRKYGTLLNVNRLHQLSGQGSTEDATEKYISEVELFYEYEGNRIIKNINKSDLCALTAELVFKLDQELAVEKPFLANLDLLDFPGARSRKELQVEAIRDDISNLILRGKVAYIFNKYSAEYLISNLLFCNRSQQLEASYIPRLLNNWISKYIGRNPEEREEFLQDAQVPPLFIIYTQFNLDLWCDTINDRARDNLIEKWNKRFNKIFKNEIVTENYNWDENWSTSERYFKNQYMLRDFKFSEDNNLFKGYQEFGKEQERVNPVGYNGDYWADLKDTFINFEGVKNYINNPEEMWEESATINKDGSGLIIENLTEASKNKVRLKKFIRELNILTEDLREEFQKYYHNENHADSINEAKEKAGRLSIELDTLSGSDPYFLSKLIGPLLINESEILRFYKNQFSESLEHRQMEYSGYLSLINANPDLSKDKSYEENMAILERGYNMTREEIEDYLTERNIDPNILFYRMDTIMASNSDILANAISNYWMEEYLRLDRFKSLTDIGFSGNNLQNLLDNIRINFKERLVVPERLAVRIRDNVNRYGIMDNAVEMVADISASMINSFVNDLGFSYNSPEKIAELERAASEYEFDLQLTNSNEESRVSEDELNNLFDIMENLHEYINNGENEHEILNKIPSLNHLEQWKQKMRVSFMASQHIPTYDPFANEELGEILEFFIDFIFHEPRNN